MRPIFIIAINTFREIIRDRILYGIMVFAVLLILLSLALGQLSFAEQARIATSFGLSAIQMSAAILSIFLGSTLVSREIEKKTIMTLLVRPVTRVQFLLGKAAGLVAVQLTVMTILALVLIAILRAIDISIQYQMFVALHGTQLEALVLLGLALFFSVFATPTMVVAFTMGLFLIGHWLDSLTYFTNKANSPEVARIVSRVVSTVVPNLDQYNWRAAVVHSDGVSLQTVSLATLNAVAWFALLVTLSSLVFRRRDFA